MEEKIYKLEFTREELTTISECGIQVCKDGIDVICTGIERGLIPNKVLILSSIFKKIFDAFGGD